MTGFGPASHISSQLSVLASLDLEIFRYNPPKIQFSEELRMYLRRILQLCWQRVGMEMLMRHTPNFFLHKRPFTIGKKGTHYRHPVVRRTSCSLLEICPNTIKSIASKIVKNVGVLYRVSQLLNPYICVTLYYALVFPHVSCGKNYSWSSLSLSH